MKSKTVKLLEGNTGSPLEHVDMGKNFLNSTPFAKELRPTINLDLIKLKSFCTAKELTF